MGENPSHFKSPLLPVEQVSWEDVQGFLERLNGEVEGLGARLPTEAEWEYACRGGTETSTWAGELEMVEAKDTAVLDGIVWYDDNSMGATQEVGLKDANPWGFYDLLGNVWEWCSDGWGSYGPEPLTDPEGSLGGSRRVVRGGSWNDHARYVRAAARNAYVAGERDHCLGFRLARGRDDLNPVGGAEEQASSGSGRR
jgi:formylglycine-generating enzyme required for sulfatase activity